MTTKKLAILSIYHGLLAGEWIFFLYLQCDNIANAEIMLTLQLNNSA